MLELTGHTILNAKVAWEELANFANNGKAEKLNQSWLPKDPDNENGSTHQLYWSSFFVTLCSKIMLYIEPPLASYSY